MQKNVGSGSIYEMIKTHKNKAGELVTRKILGEEFDKFGQKIDKGFEEERKKNIAFFASKQDQKDNLNDLKQELKADINKNQTYLEKIVAKLEKK